MKKILFATLAILVIAATSCGVQRDCQGNKHYRQKNGIYL